MRDFLTFASYRLLEALTGPLPPLVGYRLGRPVDALSLATSSQLRRTLTWNIRNVLGPHAGEDELKVVMRRACANIIRGHYDLFRLSRLSREEMLGMTRFERSESSRSIPSSGCLPNLRGRWRSAMAFRECPAGMRRS